jgi:hypothetical protein
MFADNLGLNDVRALANTSRAVNRVLTPYMYLRARHLLTSQGRPYFLRAVDTGNIIAVRHFIDIGISADIRDNVDHRLTTSLHSSVQRGDLATAQLLIGSGVNLSEVNWYQETPLYHAVFDEASQ